MKRTQTVRDALTGVIIGVTSIIMVVAFSSLIYSGPLKNFVPISINLLLIAAIILAISNLLFSSIPYPSLLLQDQPAIILAPMALLLMHNAPIDTPVLNIFLTVLLCVGLTTFITGIIFYTIGKLQLANIIRYLPYPVIGGFLAVTGWLIFANTVKMLLGQPVNFSNFLTLVPTQDFALRVLPALFAAFLIYFLIGRIKFVLEITLIMIVGLFYLVIYLLEIPPDSSIMQSYLIGPFNLSDNHFSLDFSTLKTLHFPLSLEVIAYMGLVVVVSLISLLLNATSMELIIGQEVDLNKELRLSGLSNLAVGLVGGTVGYGSLSAVRFAKAQSSGSPFTQIVTILFLCFIFFFGVAFLKFLPKIILGTFLFYMAINFLAEWLFEARKSINLIEYLIIVFIVITAIIFNMLTAVALGTLISILLFAFVYSLINPIKFKLSASSYHSSCQRSPESQAILEEKGDEIQLLKLQGFLFFGSLYKVFNIIKTMENAHYIILDFELVDNIDASRVLFLKRLAIKKNVTFVLSSLRPKIYEDLKKTGLLTSENILTFFGDQEVALQWCENQLLIKYNTRGDLEISLEDQLLNLGFTHELSQFIIENARYREFKKDEIICRAHEVANSIYFIHRGRVFVLVGHTCVYIVSSGNILGEIAFYTEDLRTATLKTDENTIVYEIDNELLANLSQDNMQMIASFHQSIARILACRLMESNKRVALFDSSLANSK